jgi:AraC family transcriptional regulator
MDAMRFATRASSAGRRWKGFDANISDTSGGFSACPGVPHHCVVMHVGAPINSSCRCDGFLQRRRAIPGDMDIVPSLCPVSWEEDGPTTMLTIHLEPWFVRLVAKNMGLEPDRVSIAPQLRLRDPKIEHIGWALAAELRAPEPSSSLYVDSLGLALAAQLLRRYAPIGPPRLRGRLSKARLRNVTDYIQDNLALELSLPELSEIAGVSMSHFKSLFKEATNLSVHQYVIQRRVEYAVQLLSNGRSSLSEVASLAGFSDQSHMARCMRRVIGITPAVVRRDR